MEQPFHKPTEEEFRATAEVVSQQRHARLPIDRDRVKALDGLHARLADNASLYEGGNLQDQRDAVADTLIKIQDYLASQGFALATLAPIMRPVEALVERENNYPDPMFAERVRAGRPKASLRSHQRTGILAALSEAWLILHADDSRPQEQKLSDAARAFKGKWFGSITKAHLKTCRDLVHQEAKDHPAVQTAGRYYGYITMTAETHGASNAIAVMIRFLNDSPSTFGLGSPLIFETPHVSPSDND
jgi:hypothetical protein